MGSNANGANLRACRTDCSPIRGRVFYLFCANQDSSSNIQFNTSIIGFFAFSDAFPYFAVFSSWVGTEKGELRRGQSIKRKSEKS